MLCFNLSFFHTRGLSFTHWKKSCGTKFLWEFIFADLWFFVFCGYWFLLLAVFQIRDGSRVNDQTKKASWPESLHISIKLSIIKRISTWSWCPLRWSSWSPAWKNNWSAGLGQIGFPAGNQFLWFSESSQYPALVIFSFFLSTCNRNYIFQTILWCVYPTAVCQTGISLYTALFLNKRDML